MTNRWAAVEGWPTPLGVSWIEEEKAYNFALYSKHATGVVLLLYSRQDYADTQMEFRMEPRTHKTGRIWHCRLPAAQLEATPYYGYRVEGPFAPEAGHRFDEHKVLLDPYARAVFFPPTFTRKAASQPGSNAGKAPLGVIDGYHAPFDWSGDAKPRHSHDTVICELHVRGYTMRPNSGVAEEKRGTYAGLIERIPYLQDLGVTVVELMPVFQYDPQEANYWGYMPLHFFSPHQGYSSVYDGAHINEFREMVKAFHQAGIEVILDVVYNHTVESDEAGPNYCFRGIDNTTYYLLEDHRSKYRDDAGTGNVLHTANRNVRRMVLDSMRYWISEIHVDGFRFDLASIFTRNSDGTVNLVDPPIISEISADPAFADVRLIAEAWDLATYQLGRNFPGLNWQQWNGRFRDDLRSFVRGDNGTVSSLMTRLYGSDDLFPDNLIDSYRPYLSVNYINSHDGFCLYDLVSYNLKHNQPNGNNNQDGTDYNLSWNCGWEGDENVPPEVMVLRKRQARNFCCLLFLANGTPMFCAGDEFLNTQRGNNNPYNQDNATSWLDWDLLQKNADFRRFFKRMIAFRKAHPILGSSRFWRDRIEWRGTGPQPDLSWESHTLAFRLREEEGGSIYVMINAYSQELDFTLPEPDAAGGWKRVADTMLPSPDDIAEPGQEKAVTGATYAVGSRSVVLLTAEP